MTLAALMVSVALVFVGGHADEASGPVEAQTSPVATATFSLKGTAAGLFPGASRPLRVSVVNPYRFAIKVTSLGVRVTPDLARRACPPGSYIRVSKLARSLRVPRRSSRRTSLRIRMLYGAPKACRGATFPLRLSATARKP
jgi:hypothetical protein